MPNVQLNTRVDDVVARIKKAKFIGKADEPMVIEKYKGYVARIAGVLQRALAFAATEAAPVELQVEEPLPQILMLPAQPLRLEAGQSAAHP